MPCLFFRNVPPGAKFEPEWISWLYKEVAYAVRKDVSGIQIHIAKDCGYIFYNPDGSRSKEEHGVHVTVEWSSGRSLPVQDAIAAAIHTFLEESGLDKGSDISFITFPPEAFYIEGKHIA